MRLSNPAHLPVAPNPKKTAPFVKYSSFLSLGSLHTPECARVTQIECLAKMGLCVCSFESVVIHRQSREARGYFLFSRGKARPQLRQVSKLVILEPFQVLLVEENLYALLDIRNLWHKARPNLVDSFADELRVLHLLSRLHDTNDGRLCGLLAYVKR